MGIGSMAGNCLNFMVGTGSEQTGEIIKRQLKNRKINNQSYLGAITEGTKKGIKLTNHRMKKNGGYLKNLKNGLGEIPKGWKNGKGFGKISGAFKGCGKAMPALMAIMMIAGEIPNAIKATKEKGIGQGAKELGKATTRLAAGALGGAIGGALIPIPFVGSLIGWMAGDWIASKIVGKSYTEKQEEQNTTEETGEQESEVAMNSIPETDVVNEYVPPQTSTVTPNYIFDTAPTVSLPPIDTGVGRYDNNIGYGMPMSGMYAMNPSYIQGQNNLLSSNGKGNLLNPNSSQNAYNKSQSLQNGMKLDLMR